MTYEERLAEVERIKKDNHAILATPSMLDGNISPMQVGMFSKRQHKRFMQDTSRRFDIEDQIRELSKTDEELEAQERRDKIKKAEGRIMQLTTHAEMVRGLALAGVHPRAYMKQAIAAEQEIASIKLELEVKS